MQPGNAWRRIALVSAIVGAGVSAYLLVEYLSNRGGVCLTGGGCDAVRTSAFAYPLGIPMSMFGVAFYLVAAWTTWRTTIPDRLFGQDPRVLLAALGLVGIGVSAFLTGVEAFVIHAYCTWCLVQAGAALALGVATLRGVAMRDGPMPIRDASRRTRRQLHDKLFARQGDWTNLDQTGRRSTSRSSRHRLVSTSRAGSMTGSQPRSQRR